MLATFTDPLANFVLGLTLTGDKLRRRKPTRLESYSRTSYLRSVCRLKGEPIKDYASAVDRLITNATSGRGLELVGSATALIETELDIDIPALKKAVKAEIKVSDQQMSFLPASPRWTPRLALWLACDLIDRKLAENLRLTLTPAEKDEALRLLHREVLMDAKGIDWLSSMTADWPLMAELAGFRIAGATATIAPYRSEVDLASQIVGDACDVLIGRRRGNGYTHAWRPDARYHLSRMKEFLLRLGFCECEIALPNLPFTDTVSRISALEKAFKGKPYPHRFFAEARPDQTMPALTVWHVSADNDPNVLAGTISSLFDALQMTIAARPDDTGADLLYHAPSGRILARLRVAPPKALKAAAPQYRTLTIAEIFPETVAAPLK